jgi:hypothetical protein
MDNIGEPLGKVPPLVLASWLYFVFSNRLVRAMDGIMSGYALSHVIRMPWGGGLSRLNQGGGRKDNSSCAFAHVTKAKFVLTAVSRGDNKGSIRSII